MSISFSNDFSSDSLVPLHHFNSKDVIDFNVMGRKSVVEEVGWEHHVVSAIPELWVILLIEEHIVTSSDKSELSNHKA